MAAQLPKTAPSKPSFASVVAMAPSPRDQQRPSGQGEDLPKRQTTPNAQSGKSKTTTAQNVPSDLQDSIARLSVSGPPPSKTLNEEAKTNIKRAGIRLDDDTNPAFSSSNKAPSLDGKSTTSGNTFALDEKESLRPDDSASAKAVEDEDSLSGPASGAPNSRVGSEAGSRAFRDQFYEVNEHVGITGHRLHSLSRRNIEGIEEEGPQMAQSQAIPPLPPPAVIPRPDGAPPIQPSMGLLPREPDEKLFEALESPKDRFFLLRLEEDIINFIKGSSEPKIDLPPCNSFCRLLAHKLADYYALTHFVDNAVSSVTLYRTPYCRIPTPLGELAKIRGAVTSMETPTAPPTMRIMRRPGTSKDTPNVDSGAGTTESSAIHSKATSEAGDDSQQGTGVVSPTGSITAREKTALTREEREARYKEKREELFGPQTEEAEGVDSKEISRANSRNEKRKRKPRKDDDGFEARSQFNICYPGIPFAIGPHDPANVSQMYFPAHAFAQQSAMMGAGVPQQFFQQGYPPMTTNQPYFSSMGNNSASSSFTNQSQAFNPQASNVNLQTSMQYYPQMFQAGSNTSQSPAMTPPAMNATAQLAAPMAQMSDQQWAQSGYIGFYPGTQQHAQQQSQQQQAFHQGISPSIPYAYGQLPFQTGQQNSKPAHPVPGSYSRPSFNPQTRAFVPANVSSSQHLSGANANAMQYSPSPNSSPMRNLPLQSASGNSHAGHGQQAHMSTHSSPSTQQQQQEHLKSYSANQSNRKTPNQGAPSTPHSGNSPAPSSSLSKWGTPANLPRKPPPPENHPSLPEGQHSLPIKNQFGGIGVQAVNGGQPMPSFQNGVYSMPGVVGP